MKYIIGETTTAYKSSFSERAGIPNVVRVLTEEAAYPILMKSLTEQGILNNFSISRPERVIGEVYYREAIHKAKVRSLRGKYSFVPTSSESFAFRKKEETQAEVNINSVFLRK